MLNALLKQNNFVFKKKLGQNFISDSNLLKNIIELSGYPKNMEILEIGAGAGTLTKLLCENFKSVVSYEIDKSLQPVLAQNLKDIKNCKLIFADVLKQDIKEIESNFEGEYCIFANLPYYITSPIIFKFLEDSTKLKSMYIMVQKEVAERLAAKPGTKDYGAPSVEVQIVADCKIVKQISRRMFYPVPDVDSCMLKIEIRSHTPPIRVCFDYKKFTRFVKACFAQRRKTIYNNLVSAYKFKKEELENILAGLNLSLNVRAEQLSVGQFAELFKIIDLGKR